MCLGPIVEIDNCNKVKCDKTIRAIRLLFSGLQFDIGELKNGHWCDNTDNVLVFFVNKFLFLALVWLTKILLTSKQKTVFEKKKESFDNLLLNC